MLFFTTSVHEFSFPVQIQLDQSYYLQIVDKCFRPSNSMLLIFSMALAVGGLHSHHCVAVIMAGSYSLPASNTCSVGTGQ